MKKRNVKPHFLRLGNTRRVCIFFFNESNFFLNLSVWLTWLFCFQLKMIILCKRTKMPVWKIEFSYCVATSVRLHVKIIWKTTRLPIESNWSSSNVTSSHFPNFPCVNGKHHIHNELKPHLHILGSSVRAITFICTHSLHTMNQYNLKLSAMNNISTDLNWMKIGISQLLDPTVYTVYCQCKCVHYSYVWMSVNVDYKKMNNTLPQMKISRLGERENVKNILL